MKLKQDKKKNYFVDLKVFYYEEYALCVLLISSANECSISTLLCNLYLLVSSLS